MKTKNLKYILYIILFIVFILIRINYILSSNAIEDVSFKSLGLANCAFPLGILKETALNDIFMPMYYYLIHFLVLFKNEIIIKIFNIIISFANVIFFFLIGKKLKNTALGLFLSTFLILNHFFLYYTNIIAPYCLNFLIGTIAIFYLIDFIKKPNKKTFKPLSIANCALIFCDTFGFIYVISELLVLYLQKKKQKRFKKYTIFLAYRAIIVFLICFPFLIIQYAQNKSLLIPNNLNGIGLNFSAIYLTINEYITPYLSFSAPENQSNSTIGMLYSLFLNLDFKSINSIKIILTLFYSSILPLLILIFMSIKSCIKNYKLRLICLIALANFAIITFLSFYEFINIHPILMGQFFISIIILLGYGIFSIKDQFLRYILVFCTLAIQVINPEINAFNIVLDKKNPTINVIETFKRDYKISNTDLLIMPYMGNYGKFYFNEYNFLNFNYAQLQSGKKKGLLRNLSSKKAKTINKKNIHYLMQDYLLENKINNHLAQQFIQECIEKNNLDKKVILFVDKMNSKPISKSSIVKCANSKEYTPHFRKIDFRYADLEQNQSKLLFDALKSKTLYNLLDLIIGNFEIETVIEYKKIDNEYYRVNKDSKNIYKALNSFESDFVFYIFKNPI